MLPTIFWKISAWGLIFAGCSNEEVRHHQWKWLYECHVPDSISQFAPYVMKYAFYNALPSPKDSQSFGVNDMQMTEHYWLINPFCEQVSTHALTERFPKALVESQGHVKDDELTEGNVDGDSARAVGGDNDMPPFVFAFIPVWWEEDLKGKGRTIADGANYRWQCIFKYPGGVTEEEGEKWFFETVVPFFRNHPMVNRMLSSKVMKEVNGTIFDRVMELWFDGPNEWYQAAVVDAQKMEKPAWIDKCFQKEFPYMKPLFEINSMFLMDRPTSDNMTQYNGFMYMR